MSMDTFNFPLHTEHTVYNDQARNLKMGGGWDYMIEPVINEPRTFNLSFGALRWITKTVEGLEMLDLDTEYDINAGRLDAFYAKHRLHQPFMYHHQKYGMLKVRFANPLNIAEPLMGSGGVVSNVVVNLIETQ